VFVRTCFQGFHPGCTSRLLLHVTSARGKRHYILMHPLRIHQFSASTTHINIFYIRGGGETPCLLFRMKMKKTQNVPRMLKQLFFSPPPKKKGRKNSIIAERADGREMKKNCLKLMTKEEKSLSVMFYANFSLDSCAV
jgi:hypothetical protein